MMKKTLSKVLAVSLALILCFSALTCGFVVSAEGGPTLKLTPDKASYAVNDTATVSVNAANWNGVIAGAQFTITGVPAGATILDKDGTAWVNTDDYAVSYDEAADTVSFLSYSNANFSAIDGVLFKLQFTSAEAAVITLGVDENTDNYVFCDANEKDITVTYAVSPVTFTAADTCTHNWVPVEVVTAATATDAGSINVKCSACEATDTKALTYYDNFKVATTIAEYASEIKLGIKVRKDRLAEKGEDFTAYGYFSHYISKGDTTKQTFMATYSNTTVGSSNRAAREYDYVVKAMQATESIKAYILVCVDGIWYNGPVYNTSIRTYADEVLAKAATTEAEKKLIVNMLQYAEKMQIYKSYNNTTENLATYGLSAADAALITTTAPEITATITRDYDSASDPFIKKYQLDMADKIMADMYFRTDRYSGNKDTLKVVATWQNAKGADFDQTFSVDPIGDELPYVNELQDGEPRTNHYYFTFSRLSSYDLRQPITFTIKDGETACSTYIASIEAIVNELISKTTNPIPEAEAIMYKAMLNYSDASRDFFAPATTA